MYKHTHKQKYNLAIRRKKFFFEILFFLLLLTLLYLIYVAVEDALILLVVLHCNVAEKETLFKTYFIKNHYCLTLRSDISLENHHRKLKLGFK